MTTKDLSPFLLYFGMLLSIAGCVEAVDWELSPEENGRLVVEAILTDADDFQLVRLSTSYDSLNQEVPSISNAEVMVSSLADDFIFSAVPNEPGLYQSDQAFACQKDVLYQLKIEWEGQNFTASNTLSFVSPLQEIVLNQIAETDSFTIQEVAPLYHPLEQAFYEINLDWRQVIPGDSSRAKMYFYTFNTVDGSELFRPNREVVQFPKGTILYEKKFGMNDGFAEYMRALMLETEWKGGIFDEASSSLPTNIEGGGLGYFAVCSTLRDTLLVQ